ncbi:hypothetical protein C1X52_19185 [Pseudomonas sp. FW306-2-1A-C05A]|nr:hypothetical protein C1X52_19185 [Pseudomonas sp. FW306-2-1A-C05A]PMW64364.1 hypothetical protein C1X46_29240 [Pseudomonas sp. FW306-07-L]POA73057.1 hypothetical protein C1890_28385 [Pseudomonas sp. DP16D-R1]
MREWVNENRSELSDRFAEKYGNQIQEWADFAEYEFDQAFPRVEANLSPTSTETHAADELVEESTHTPGPRS